MRLFSDIGFLLAFSLPCAQPEAGAYTIVGSRSHQTPEFAAFVSAREKEYERVAVRSIGSSLKIWLVAEGAADVYPRLRVECNGGAEGDATVLGDFAGHESDAADVEFPVFLKEG